MGRTGKGLRWAGTVNSWMPTHPGKSWARTPWMKTAQHSLRQSYSDTLDYKWHSLGKQNIYLKTWTINGYGHRTVQEQELN